MRRPPVPSLATVASHVVLPSTAAGGTWLAMLKAVPKAPDVVVIGAVMAAAAIAGVMPKIVESISKRLPAIIRAWHEARDSRLRRKMQNKLLGEVAGGNDNAKEALRLQAISPDLPPGRRLPDEVLKHQWALLKIPPKTPTSGGAPPAGGGAEVVRLPVQPPPDKSNQGQPHA